MDRLQAELLLDAKSTLGEGPAWLEVSQILYWVDIIGKSINSYDAQTGRHENYPVGDSVGALAPCRNGGLILALRKGLARYTPGGKQPQYILEVEKDLPDNRFNDGKCDPAGRFWAGTMGPAISGSLYRIDPSLKITRMVDGIKTSNGLAWNTGINKFYYIDTPTRRVDAFDYDKATGEIANRQPCIHIPVEDGFPDGMTIDREGMLWIAHWQGWAVYRYNPLTGEKLLKVELPAAKITSCVFGGKNLDTLHITSARAGLTENELKAQPLAGGLFIYKTQTQGWPVDEFDDATAIA